METTEQPSPPAPTPVPGRRARLWRRLGVGDALPIDPDLAPEDAAAPSPTHHRGPHVRRARPAVLAVIAGGGFLGTLARYELGLAWPTASGHFPAATFAINTSGAFLLGLFLAMAIERRPPTTYLRPFAATGLLGGWTTYSTLAVETTTFAKDGDLATAAAYLALTFAAGLLAAVLGIALGRARTPSPGMLPEMAEVTEGEETSR